MQAALAITPPLSLVRWPNVGPESRYLVSPWGRLAAPETVSAAECQAADAWIWPRTCTPGSLDPVWRRWRCSGRFQSSRGSSRSTGSASGGTSVGGEGLNCKVADQDYIVRFHWWERTSKIKHFWLPAWNGYKGSIKPLEKQKHKWTKWTALTN